MLRLMQNQIKKQLHEKGIATLGADALFTKQENLFSVKIRKKYSLPVNLLKGINHSFDDLIESIHLNYSTFTNSSITIEELEDSVIFSSTSLEDLFQICTLVQKYYSELNIHITRMFGSYILIAPNSKKLEAKFATKTEINYCPLMFKLLKQQGASEALLQSLLKGNIHTYQTEICHFINEVILPAGGFDDNRPLNSCERNVSFGASESMADSIDHGIIDAAVIVSNNLGTVITNTSSTTQGVVKRMSGLFYTSPSPNSIDNAYHSNIFPVFPITGDIDQLEGVKQAIQLGYKRIAVSVAADDNKLLSEISKLEKDGITIYKFGLCATGVTENTATIMAKNADVIWSCASKYVRELVAPASLLQIGIKIPVYIMNTKGLDIIKPRLLSIDPSFDFSDITLTESDEKTVIYNQSSHLVKTKFKNLKKCVDCPHPCV